MFKHLMDLKIKRSPLQALGFYIFWLALFLFFNGFLAQIFIALNGSGKGLGVSESYKNGVETGRLLTVVIGPLFTITISALLIYIKKLSPWYYFAAIFGGMMSGVTIIAGLIPAAIISTRESR